MNRYDLQTHFEEDFLIESAEDCLSSLSVLAHNHYLQEAISLLEKYKNNPSVLADEIEKYKKAIELSGGTVLKAKKPKLGLLLLDHMGRPL